ncbi:MAG: aminotransferase class V-fold PLP-dependent enzyme [Abditibacteriales bacterium]|nr:aminotransferase class V-fold PLP-dependent enzyme [Abditibacteriales bacterium]MDW8367356.1 aminotransferase class V-fold PLP-dependent enzyme [Abditibacteriales bacterium]
MVSYADLGVRRVINAMGTVTTLGGSLMPQEVLDAMYEAARMFVSIPELQEKAGERIARLTGAEAAYVCAGAACGLMLGTAACMTRGIRERMNRLPDTQGMPHECIMLAAHRNGFDFAIRQTGARIVEVGTVENGATAMDVISAIGQNTALIAFFMAFEQRGKLSLDEVLSVGRSYNVPVLVDAAAELPPAENLTKFISMGADLVVFSGGKGLRGPQSSGFICGRKDLIAACAAQGSPNAGIGRVAKVGKEEIMGLLAALERFVQLDHEAERRQWEAQVNTILDTCKGIVGVRAMRLFPNERGQPIPQAVLRLEPHAAVKAAELARYLAEGDPSIRVRQVRDTILINPHMLEPSDEYVICERLRSILG